MTVAIYISPKSYIAPFLITDTLQSDLHGKVIGEVATRQRVEGFGHFRDFNSLARKNTTLRGDTVVAFSGSVTSISDFLEYAPLSLGTAEDERPLRALAQRASLYGAEDLNVLSLMAKADNQLAKVKPDRVFEFEIDGLGYVAAIGSGAEAIIETVRRLAGTRASEFDNDVALAFAIAEQLCSLTLFQEVYDDSGLGAAEERTWGGLLEYIHYNPVEKRWIRRKPTAFAIYESHIGDDGTASPPRMIDRQFAYEPGSCHGWLSAIRRSESAFHNIDYRINNVLSGNRDVSIYDWNAWKPEQVSLAIVSGKNDGRGLEGISYYLGGYEVDDFNGVEIRPSVVGPSYLPYGEKLEDFFQGFYRHLRGA